MRPFCASVFVLGLILSPTSSLAADGDALYASECARCHGATGDGDTPAGKAMKVPAVAGHDTAGTVSAVRENEKHKTSSAKLSDDELQAIAEYLAAAQ